MIRVFHVRRGHDGLLTKREVFAPWAANLGFARVAWALHLASEQGGSVEVVRV